MESKLVKWAMAALAGARPAQKRVALRDLQFTEVDDGEVDVDFENPARFLSTHANNIPLISAVPGMRAFYGARFWNQALPTVQNEAPWVQSLDPDNSTPEQEQSFDDVLGKYAGAMRAEAGGTVVDVTPDWIDLEDEQGEKRRVELYNRMPFNRYSGITNRALVKPGDQVQPGQMLARSNYTDDQGTLALGVNARVGVAPYLGHTMDDALVVSAAFAKRMASDQLLGHDLEYKRGVQGGRAHFMGMFPRTFNNRQLDQVDDEGVVKPGTILEPGDPLVLATKPRVISSSSAQLGLLSKHMKNARQNASLVWEQEVPGKVVDVEKLRSGVRVNVEAHVPVHEGDKAVFRSGAKGVISRIIPDEQMPRTADGQPLEVLLNPLSIPSRSNDSLIFELLLGKVAAARGKPYKLDSFTKPGSRWYEFVEQQLQEAGLTDTEEVFDPAENRKLENPILVGNAHMLRLYHTAASKVSARGQGSYTANNEPLHGGGGGGGSKRLSGLDTNALLSSGAYGVLRDGATVRGTRNDTYWSTLRQGHEPKAPGSPFVWDKFRMLLTGAGYHTKKLGEGRLRLQFWTDKDLDQVSPIDVRNGETVELGTLKPVPGGLFDDALTGANSWGQIRLPTPLPNPAAADVIKKLLGLTDKEFRGIIAGEIDLPERLRPTQKF